MKYFVAVAGREFEVVVEGEQVMVDGLVFTAHLSTIEGTPVRHLLIGERSFTLPFENPGSGKWTMGFQGESWEATVVDERTRHIQTLTGAGTARRGGGELKAPMPGLVVRVDVEVGQPVAAGASVIVLEAMKMQNELRASGSLVVAAVRVVPGQAVEKGQVLVEFEGTSG